MGPPGYLSGNSAEETLNFPGVRAEWDDAHEITLG
jgi:hypothetical protein